MIPFQGAILNFETVMLYFMTVPRHFQFIPPYLLASANYFRRVRRRQKCYTQDYLTEKCAQVENICFIKRRTPAYVVRM